jgi:hypothetical protein
MGEKQDIAFDEERRDVNVVHTQPGGDVEPVVTPKTWGVVLVSHSALFGEALG